MKKAIKALIISSVLLGTGVKIFSGGVESNISDTKGSITQLLDDQITLKKLKELYGFDIIYSESGGLDNLYNIEYFDKKEIDIIISRFYNEVLSKYPKGFIEKAYLRNVYLFKKISLKNGDVIGGFESRGIIYLNASSENIHQFDHELFHRFDNKDGNNDDEKWANIFGNTQKPQNKDFSINMGDEVPGYADKYGMTQGINEDQATIIEYLLNPNKKSRLLERAKQDEFLRKKIMIITGAFFDKEKGDFTRDLTKQEYIDLSGFSDYEYYRKWSNGIIDFNFWNK